MPSSLCSAECICRQKWTEHAVVSQFGEIRKICRYISNAIAAIEKAACPHAAFGFLPGRLFDAVRTGQCAKFDFDYLGIDPAHPRAAQRWSAPDCCGNVCGGENSLPAKWATMQPLVSERMTELKQQRIYRECSQEQAASLFYTSGFIPTESSDCGHTDQVQDSDKEPLCVNGETMLTNTASLHMPCLKILFR